VAIEDVLKYARSSKEKSRSDTDVINELRSQVQEQDRLLKALAAGGALGAGLGAAGGGMGERAGLLGAAPRGGAPGYGALQTDVSQAQGQGMMIELSSEIGKRAPPTAAAAAFADGGKKVCSTFASSVFFSLSYSLSFTLCPLP
jgi:hypothetical protein